MRKLYCIAIAIFFLISACTKIETTDIGSGLIPPIDGVTTLDTSLEVITDNILNTANDSLRVAYIDDHVIGIINNDPLFGKTTAKTYFELKPTSYKFSFPGGNSLVADSAVLILSYKGVFGDTTIPQNWEVREVTEEIKNDSAYFVSKQFATGNTIGSKTLDLRAFDDSVKYGFELAKNQIRIKLDPVFAARFINQYDSSDNHAYQNDSLFRKNFKGFEIGPAAGSSGNALIRINLLDTNTKLALFYNYRIPDSTKPIETVSYFRFSEGSSVTVPASGSANYIHRDNSGSKLGDALSNSTLNDDLLYIQTSPGSVATIKIPGLPKLQNFIVHRAELAMYEVPDANPANQFTKPQYLLLHADSGKQKINVPNDFTYSSTAGVNTYTFGGYLVEKNIPGYNVSKAYIFDLTRYVQGIVTRHDSSLALRLYAPSRDSLKYTAPYPLTATTEYYISPSNANNVAMGRVVLAGGAAALPLRMRLRIIYSRI